MDENTTVIRKIQQIDGGWKGVESLQAFDLLRSQRHTMQEIAEAFGCKTRNFYYLLAKARAELAKKEGDDATTSSTQYFESSSKDVAHHCSCGSLPDSKAVGW